MDNHLFDYLFNGALSSRQERIEDYTTELLAFMWEIDNEFKSIFLDVINSKLQENKSTSRISEEAEISTQESERGSRYDLVIRENENFKIIFENKINSNKNQFPGYLK